MKIITYPHPTLRHKSSNVVKVDAELRDMVAQMVELMYEAKGVGLAANQVDLPLRLFVCNPAGNADEGEEFVFINPVISKPKGTSECEEGCLSMPGLYESIVRPESIHVEAYSINGEEIKLDLDGFFSRVVQHETDHLDGVLFTDRLSELRKNNVAGELEELELDFQNQRSTGLIPSDEEIYQRLHELEVKYCGKNERIGGRES